MSLGQQGHPSGSQCLPLGHTEQGVDPVRATSGCWDLRWGARGPGSNCQLHMWGGRGTEGAQPSRGPPHGERGVGRGEGAVISSLAESWPGRIPAPRWPLRLLPHAGQLGWGLLFHGRPVFTVGRGGASCAQHMSPGSPGPPYGCVAGSSWPQAAPEQRAFEQPARLLLPSGQLTLPGTPRPAPSVAYWVPRGGGTAGPRAADRDHSPRGNTSSQGRAAPTSSRDLTPVTCALALVGGMVWPPCPPAPAPFCLVKSCLPRKAQVSFSPRKPSRGPTVPAKRPRLCPCVGHVWRPRGRLGGRCAFFRP